jgi:hypothetical protein
MKLASYSLVGLDSRLSDCVVIQKSTEFLHVMPVLNEHTAANEVLTIGIQPALRE